MTAPAPTPVSAPPAAPSAAGGVQTVRRFITYLLLFVMVVIAAIGLSGLLERVLDDGSMIAFSDNAGLAQSLAFTLIAGPLAALLWWLTWRESAMSRDRASIAWPLYLVLASTVALLVFTLALFAWAEALIADRWQPSNLAIAIVWGLVWIWHYWMWRHPAKAPVRLIGVAPAIASLTGLWMGVGGLVDALGTLIDSATETFTVTTVIGIPLWQAVLQPLVWAVGGGLLWWWHWFRAGVREQRTGFATVLLVFVTGFASFALFIYGVTFTLYTVLRLLVTAGDPLSVILDPLGLAVSSAAFGALVLVYHSRVVTEHPDAVHKATGLVASGVALATAATGVGVTVNALLASFSPSLVGADQRPLLIGGISALLVGGALWWASWRPGSASSAARISTPGRRVYLVVIFGLSALVALITLLVIGYQLFSFALDGASGGSLLERTRQALGLLVATVLVAAYHFVLWRGDRAAMPSVESRRTIEKVTLVSSPASDLLVTAIHEATGARVTVLRRADAVAGEPDAAALVAALDGIEARHVLVVAGAEGRTEVVRLEG
ncbi:hypothetical protein GCM10022239_09890 [Leifsonia bigeumensis]|uniref:DUF5671 domain-containing protein n=1 Tax=Leifsonella bigeumensis TaxID=433643 RepID=A0ABP7FE28_9MICO